MKRGLIMALAAGFAVTAISAQAADVPQRDVRFYKALVQQPNLGWAGDYFGVHISYTKSDIGSPGIVDFDLSGITGGVSYTRLWQSDLLVYGLAVDASFGKIDGATTVGPVDVSGQIKTTVDLRARLGYEVMPDVLLSAQGGLRMAKIDTSISAGALSASDSQWHAGWIVGAAVDWRVAPNWLVTVEANWFDLGSQNHSYALAAPVALAVPVEADGFEIKLGAKYRFRTN